MRLSMPAALLLLFAYACNNNKSVKEAAVSQLNRSAKETESQLPVAADSVASANFNEEEKKAPEPKDQGGTPRHSPGGNPQAVPAPSNPDWDRKIVKTANLNLEIKNFKSFDTRLHDRIKQFGGYIAQESQSQSDYKIENTVVIKVPVEQFSETMAQLASDTDKIIEKRVSSEDVTMQVIDTKSRMETKREVRQRYLDFLKQAKNMSEILKVQHEINDIQEEIESASGRIAYLSHAAAFSTINLTYFQVLDAGAKNQNEPSFFQKLKESFETGWTWVVSLLLGMVSLWPLWGAIGLAWIGIKKLRQTRKSKPAA